MSQLIEYIHFYGVIAYFPPTPGHSFKPAEINKSHLFYAVFIVALTKRISPIGVIFEMFMSIIHSERLLVKRNHSSDGGSLLFSQFF